MKQKLLFLLAILVGVPGWSQSFQFTYEGQTLTYEEVDPFALNCMVTGWRPLQKGELVIPEKVLFEDKEYTVTDIKKYAFDNCEELTSIKIPSTITTIGIGAFKSCSNLTSIYYDAPKANNDDDRYWSNPVFEDCVNLRNIEFGPNVIEIPYYFFKTIPVEKIVLPDNVKYIRSDGFASCENVREIVLGKGLEVIEATSFAFDREVGQPTTVYMNAANLKSYTGHYGETGPLADWLPLKGRLVDCLVFGESVETVCENAFPEIQPHMVKSLNPVPPTLGDGSLYNVNKENCPLYVPEGSEKLYAEAPIWKKFKNIKSLTEIQNPEPPKPETSLIPASVDLGLSVNWSTFNWGATKPWEYGTLYGWGALASYPIDNNIYPNQDDIANTEYDIIARDWGHGYRMPSDSELRELCNSCQWEYTEIEDTKGYKVTGPNGNSIFIPAAGRYDDGIYQEVGERTYLWSGEEHSSRCGSNLHIHEDVQFMSFTPKYVGITLRGVTTEIVEGESFSFDTENKILATSIELDHTEECLNVGDTLKLVATIMPRETFDKSVTWSSSNPEVASVDENGEVHAVAPGNVIISASTCNGLKAECSVTVNEPLDKLDLYIRLKSNEIQDSSILKNWQLRRLGDDENENIIYCYLCETDILPIHSELTVTSEDGIAIAIGAAENSELGMDTSIEVKNGSNEPLELKDEFYGVMFMKMNYDTQIGEIYISNNRQCSCPFDFDGEYTPPADGLVKVEVTVSDNHTFIYETNLLSETNFTVQIDDPFWEIVSYCYNGKNTTLESSASSYKCNFRPVKNNSFLFTLQYCGTLDIIDEVSGITEVMNGVSISKEGNYICLSGLEKDMEVVVYSLGGHKITSRIATNPEMKIALDENQTYIIRAGNCAVKFLL